MVFRPGSAGSNIEAMRRLLVLVAFLLPFGSVLSDGSLAAPRTEAAGAALPIGRPVTLTGDGSRVQVTLLAYSDPARSCCYRPRKGTRFVVFKIRYVNLRNTWFTTIPASDVELVDSLGDVYDTLTTQYGSRLQSWPVRAPDLNHGLKLRPRERRTGYMGWVLPSKLRLREFRY